MPPLAGVAATLVAALVAGLVAVSASPAAAQEQPPPPNYNACAGDAEGGFWRSYGAAAYRVVDGVQYWKAYNCPDVWAQAESVFFRVYYYDNDSGNLRPPVDWCLGLHSVVDIGVRGRVAAGYIATIGGPLANICSPSDYPDPTPIWPPDPPGEQPELPRVTVSGTVVADRRMSVAGQTSPLRPLPDAKWELWYEGKAGHASDAVEWRPVPALGSDLPLTGYLDEQGRFDLEFIYPQNHGDWYGCAPTAVNFMQSTACADDKLVLKVFPVDADVSASVKEPGHFEPGDHLPMATIALGHFFQRDPRPDYRAGSIAAQSWAAIYNVRDLVGAETLGDAHIQLKDGDDTISSYDPNFGILNVHIEEGASSVIEHELGHLLMHSLYGLDFVLWIQENCRNHYLDRPSSADCAWSEGFADWIEVMAENEPGQTSWTTWMNPTGPIGDIESRTDVTGGFFNPGAEVEGNIAAALFDLVDNNPPQEPDSGDLERRFNIFDVSSHRVEQLLQVIGDAEPRTFAEFWPAWVEFNAGEERDAQTLWLNTLHYAAMIDADPFDGSGVWERRGCDDCLLDDVVQSKDPDGTLTWKVLDPPQAVHESERWDIWVYIPRGENLDRGVQYEVKTKVGQQTFTLDQQTRQGQWVLLNPSGGIDLNEEEPVTVKLARTKDPASEGTLVKADGLLIAPRLPW